MIKYLNDGELRHLRTGYYVTLLLKLISNYDYEKFIKLKEDFPRAIRLYKYLVCLNEPGQYSGYSKVMLRYLFKNDIITENLYNNITEHLKDDTVLIDDELDDDDLDDEYYYDEYEVREKLLIDLFRAMGSKKSINIEFETTSTLYACQDINESLFGDIQKELRCNDEPEHFLNTDYDDLIDEYCSSCEVDSLVIGIENYVFNDHLFRLLQKMINEIACKYWDNSYNDISIRNGNTYITISYGMIENMNYTFLIIIILAFIEN